MTNRLMSSLNLIWIIGYDWKKGRVTSLQRMLAQQFKNHGGIGAYFDLPSTQKTNSLKS